MKKLVLVFLIWLVSQLQAVAQQHWATPNFATVQYAGSTGYVSAGIGYNLLNNKARLSGHFGTVPLTQGGAIHIISTKLMFNPTTLTVWNRVKMRPVDLGLLTSYNIANKVVTGTLQGREPVGYYWWNPAFRIHMAMESSVTYEFKKGHPVRAVTGFVEFNTNERYFATFVRNIRTISVWDVVKVGTGARISF